jgi:F-type H+-transporting ATPase subunit epsilon
MPSNFRLDVITPERTFFSGEVESIIVPTEDGLMGILKGHEPIVIAIEIGTVKFMVDGEWHECATSEAFMEVRPDETIIFSQAMEWPEEIDLSRALAAKERAEERLRQQKSYQEYMQSKIALARAMVRLKVGRQRQNID